MGRRPTESDYGLAPLTFAEAARVLKLDTGAFMNWVMEHARPSASQWTDWTGGEKGVPRRAVPERLIRLYLTKRLEEEQRLQEEYRVLADAHREAQAPIARPVRRAKPLRDRRRAAG